MRRLVGCLSVLMLLVGAWFLPDDASRFLIHRHVYLHGVDLPARVSVGGGVRDEYTHLNVAVNAPWGMRTLTVSERGWWLDAPEPATRLVRVARDSNRVIFLRPDGTCPPPPLGHLLLALAFVACGLTGTAAVAISSFRRRSTARSTPAANPALP